MSLIHHKNPSAVANQGELLHRFWQPAAPRSCKHHHYHEHHHKKDIFRPGDSVMNAEKRKPSFHKFFEESHAACRGIRKFIESAAKSACRVF